jgi:hypothetical protein
MVKSCEYSSFPILRQSNYLQLGCRPSSFTIRALGETVIVRFNLSYLKVNSPRPWPAEVSNFEFRIGLIRSFLLISIIRKSRLSPCELSRRKLKLCKPDTCQGSQGNPSAELSCCSRSSLLVFSAVSLIQVVSLVNISLRVLLP